MLVYSRSRLHGPHPLYRGTWLLRNDDCNARMSLTSWASLIDENGGRNGGDTKFV